MKSIWNNTIRSCRPRVEHFLVWQQWWATTKTDVDKGCDDDDDDYNDDNAGRDDKVNDTNINVGIIVIGNRDFQIRGIFKQ